MGQKIRDCQTISGGCIAHAQKIITEDGKYYFLKSGGTVGMFPKEAKGLQEIAQSRSLSVPEVIAASDDFLLLSFVEGGKRPPDFFENFARRYAEMHRYRGEEFGFYEDNFIGNTPQLNIAENDEKHHWTTFFFNKRLKFQFDLAEKNAYISPTLRRLFSKLEDKIEHILEDNTEMIPSLLHGDLWGGNYMVGSSGEAVLIDPAVYYGAREADLAMSRIFGGFPPSFYAAYEESFPLADGWEYRENIYRLYHMLNHLNLFGRSYYQGVVSIVEYYVK